MKLLVSLFCLLINSTAIADWEHLANDDFYDVCVYADSVYFVASTEGRLLISRDRGRTWSGKQLDSALTSVDVGANANVVTSGLSGRLFISNDLGESWDTVQLANSSTIYRVRALANAQFIVAGDGGSVAKSTDNGRSWHQGMTVDSVEDFHAMDVFGQSIIVLGSLQGKLYYSSDAGSTWRESFKSNALIRSVNFSNAGIGIVAGERSLVLQTLDKGITWTKLTLPDEKYKLCFGASLGSGRIFLSFFGGNLESDDSGRNWKRTSFPQAGSNARVLRAIVTTDGSLVGVGKPCMIVRSIDTARSWTYESIGIDDFRAFFQVQVLDSTTYIAAGEKNLVTYSTNRGLTWSNRLHPIFFYTINALHFWSLDSGVILGDGGFCDITSDRGKSWTHLNTWPHLALFYRVKIFGESEVALISDSTVWHSQDRLKTFTKRVFFPNNQNYNFTGLQIRRDDLWYATAFRFNWTSDTDGEDFALFMRSSNKGVSWEIVKEWYEHRKDALAFINDSMGVLGGQYGQILKTYDGAQTWVVVHDEPEIGYVTSIAFADEKIGYASLQQGRSLFTTDGGNSWQHDDLVSRVTTLGQRYHHFGGAVWADSNTILFAASHGIARKRIDRKALMPSSVNEMETRGWRPLVTISSNPNPAFDLVQIDVAGLHSMNAESTELLLFDVNGVPVMDLTTQFRRGLHSGSAKLEASIKDLPSGIYLLKLTDRSGSYTAKLVVAR